MLQNCPEHAVAEDPQVIPSKRRHSSELLGTVLVCFINVSWARLRMDSNTDGLVFSRSRRALWRAGHDLMEYRLGLE